MDKLKCEICGCGDIVKQGEFFVCQGCGVKYDLDAAAGLAGKGETEAPTASRETDVARGKKPRVAISVFIAVLSAIGGVMFSWLWLRSSYEPAVWFGEGMIAASNLFVFLSGVTGAAFARRARSKGLLAVSVWCATIGLAIMAAWLVCVVGTFSAVMSEYQFVAGIFMLVLPAWAFGCAAMRLVRARNA